jgi:hypothetical protein
MDSEGGSFSSSRPLHIKAAPGAALGPHSDAPVSLHGEPSQVELHSEAGPPSKPAQGGSDGKAQASRALPPGALQESMDGGDTLTEFKAWPRDSLTHQQLVGAPPSRLSHKGHPPPPLVSTRSLRASENGIRVSGNLRGAWGDDDGAVGPSDARPSPSSVPRPLLGGRSSRVAIEVPTSPTQDRLSLKPGFATAPPAARGTGGGAPGGHRSVRFPDDTLEGDPKSGDVVSSLRALASTAASESHSTHVSSAASAEEPCVPQVWPHGCAWCKRMQPAGDGAVRQLGLGRFPRRSRPAASV